MESVRAKYNDEVTNLTPKSCVDQSDEKSQFALSKAFNHNIINALNLCFRGCRPIVNIFDTVTPIITRRFNNLKNIE